MDYPQDFNSLVEHLKAHPWVYCEHPNAYESGSRMFLEARDNGILWDRPTNGRTFSPTSSQEGIHILYEPAFFQVQYFANEKLFPVNYHYQTCTWFSKAILGHFQEWYYSVKWSQFPFLEGKEPAEQDRERRRALQLLLKDLAQYCQFIGLDLKQELLNAKV